MVIFFTHPILQKHKKRIMCTNISNCNILPTIFISMQYTSNLSTGILGLLNELVFLLGVCSILRYLRKQVFQKQGHAWLWNLENSCGSGPAENLKRHTLTEYKRRKEDDNQFASWLYVKFLCSSKNNFKDILSRKSYGFILRCLARIQ